jgi:hypothetical protein
MCARGPRFVQGGNDVCKGVTIRARGQGCVQGGHFFFTLDVRSEELKFTVESFKRIFHW